MSWRPKDEVHRTGVLKLLEYFKTNGVPVDALGIQSHIGSSKEPLGPDGFEIVDEAAWRKFLDEVTGMGFDLVITEFDVNDRYLPADFGTRDRMVAEHGKRYLDLMLSYPQLRYVMAWGIVDKYSWLQGNTPRADGLPKRDTPYDSAFKPKKLREAMAEAFATAPARPLLDAKPA
jgi:endo-1,4-beta-xylanase